MRIAAISYGTEGDVRPMLALGRELAARGHQLVLAGDANGAAAAAAQGIDYVSLSGDLRDEISGSGRIAQLVRRGGAAVNGIAPVRVLLREHLHRWTTDLMDAAQGADAVLSSGLSLPAGFNAAEALGVPVIATFFQPFTASRHLKSSMLPPRLPLALHGPLFRLGNQAAWGAVRGIVNDSRAKLGLEPQQRLWSSYRQFGAWSPTLVPAPPDWGPEVSVVGQWELAGGAGWQPDDKLAGFLADGEAPVYAGFGSMAAPPELLAAAVEALDGRRCLLSPGWSRAVPERLPDTVHVVGHVPHDWLFGQVSAVVHHCGAGTSHSAVRAGVPSVAVPFTADQPFWADRLHTLGLATRPVPVARASASALRQAMDHVDELAPQVARAAAGMRQEDGCGAAVGLLEELVAASR